MIFTNISNFHNTNDYLPILNGCIIADLIIIFLLINKFYKSKLLILWYKKYQLSAIIADVLILVIGIIIARFLYRYIFKTWNIINFIFLVVSIQIIHDILFYLFFSSFKRGNNEIMDFFKDYANEVSYGAIIGDSFMITIAALFASYFAKLNLNTNLIVLIIAIYLVPYFIGGV